MRRRGKQCSSWSRPHASWRSWPFWRESAGGDRDPDRHVGRRSGGGRQALRRGARAPSSQVRPGYDETVKVRKAVFPAAGLGTRFLPATKAQPKEMLPVVDKPIIQYGVEEAGAPGPGQKINGAWRDPPALGGPFGPSFAPPHTPKRRRTTR